MASQSAAYTESAAYTDPMDAFNFDKPTYEYFTPLRLRPGAQKKSPGYHAELVCLTPWVNGVPPEGIKCLTINANFGLMAYGNGSGLVIGQAHHMFSRFLNLRISEFFSRFFLCFVFLQGRSFLLRSKMPI